jgi:hypothetical protein
VNGVVTLPHDLRSCVRRSGQAENEVHCSLARWPRQRLGLDEASPKASEGWRRGWDSNPTAFFGFCKLQIPNCQHCRESQRCRGTLHAVARTAEIRGLRILSRLALVDVIYCWWSDGSETWEPCEAGWAPLRVASPRHYLANGSGRSWKCAASGLVPFPPSMSHGVRSPLADQRPRPFQPPFGSSMRPSRPFA